MHTEALDVAGPIDNGGPDDAVLQAASVITRLHAIKHTAHTHIHTLIHLYVFFMHSLTCNIKTSIIIRESGSHPGIAATRASAWSLKLAIRVQGSVLPVSALGVCFT